ncbi:MAG TPA: hypothetical protein VG818_01265 [Gemmatimonadaceae bacterium]|jgi:hypothetical protein|nr:hypothetical protein [Gemmatimonadaceae bacterium]
MGAAAFIIVVAGLVVPITLLLLTALADAIVVAWALYRLWHDRWWPFASRVLADHVVGPAAMALHLRARPGLPRA